MYRYNTKDIFRPHTDGSWPGSGLDKEKKRIVPDLYDGAQHSMLTFLIYLNDDCRGGETTFYYHNDPTFRKLKKEWQRECWGPAEEKDNGGTTSSQKERGEEEDAHGNVMK